jgi:hypothetical protein
MLSLTVVLIDTVVVVMVHGCVNVKVTALISNVLLDLDLLRAEVRSII